MSYLVLPAGIPDFNKAVISLWFRVPQVSINKKLAGESSDILPRTIPLFTFGRPQVWKEMLGPQRDVAVYHFEPVSGVKAKIMDSPVWHAESEIPVSPSYIGVNCSGSKACLHFNLQMEDYAPYKGLYSARSRVDVYSQQQMPTVDNTPGNGWTNRLFTTLADVSYKFNNQPEYFHIETAHGLSAEHWHHLLLSFDLSGAMSVGQPHADSSCKLWYAIDDVDYRGAENLLPYRASDDGLGQNDILTQKIHEVSHGVPEPALIWNVWFGPATGTYDPLPLPSSGAEFGIPAASNCVEHILKVEMAELQIFTGVTLDTGLVTNRRAFVSAEGRPVPPAKAETLLHRRPAVLLHYNHNWKAGKNTGYLGITPDGELIPAGQFHRQGVINIYRPEPSLHGQQSPQAVPQAVPVQLSKVG